MVPKICRVQVHCDCSKTISVVSPLFTKVIEGISRDGSTDRKGWYLRFAGYKFIVSSLPIIQESD